MDPSQITVPFTSPGGGSSPPPPPPPRTAESPPPPPPSPPGPSTPAGPSFEDRIVALMSRSLDKFQGVNWIAALGALFVAAAAIALLTQQWEAMSALTQLGAMAGATTIVGGAALGSRRAAPGTSGALTHLTGVLFCLVAGATVLVMGQGWPAAAAACGIVGVLATEALRRIVGSHVHEILSVIAVAVAAGGLGALVGFPAAIIAAGAAIAFVVVDPTNRAGEGLAALAAASPLLAALNDATFTGQGTLRDMGLLGPALGWAAPLAATVATIALSLRFRSTREWRYLAIAAAGLAASGVAAWTVYQPSTSWFGLALAALFLIVQAAALLVSNDSELEPLADIIGRRADVFLGSLVSLIVAVTSIEAALVGHTDSATIAAAGFATVGWLIGAYRRSSLGNLFMAALMVSFGLVAALVPAWIIGVAITLTSAALIAVSMKQRDEDFFLSSLVGLSIGWWVITVDVAIGSAMMWAAPVAFALALYCEFDRRPQWALWGTSLSLMTATGVCDYAIHNQAMPLNVLAAVGAAAVVVGAMRRRAVPVLLGAVMSVGAAGYQVLDASIGIEGWGWLALTGVALLTAAAAYEFSGSRSQDELVGVTSAQADGEK